VPDLRARPLSPATLSALIARKPWLLRPLATQLLPPPLQGFDPAERLGIDLASVQTADDLHRVVGFVWAALSRSEIGSAEAARVAGPGLRAVRRFSHRLRRLARLTAQKSAPVPAPID
jgi:hypothetical protein